MTPDDNTLRIITSKHWPGPLPGMRDIYGNRVLEEYGSEYVCSDIELIGNECDYGCDHARRQSRHFVPDFKDPATFYLLRGIVAKAHGGTELSLSLLRGDDTPGVEVVVCDDYREVKYRRVFYPKSGNRYLEALALAFENAPEIKG